MRKRQKKKNKKKLLKESWALLKKIMMEELTCPVNTGFAERVHGNWPKHLIVDER